MWITVKQETKSFCYCPLFWNSLCYYGVFHRNFDHLKIEVAEIVKWNSHNCVLWKSKRQQTQMWWIRFSDKQNVRKRYTEDGNQFLIDFCIRYLIVIHEKIWRDNLCCYGGFQIKVFIIFEAVTAEIFKNEVCLKCKLK